MAVTKKQLGILAPYLEPAGPSDETNEWGMHCPLHEDATRSASLNVETGVWFCHACDLGGTVSDLVDRIPSDGNGDTPNQNSVGTSARAANLPTEEEVRRYAQFLQRNKEPLDEFVSRRGINADTLIRFEIGYDLKSRAYTIPIRDENDLLCNIRRYQFDPPNERRKIWSINGLGTPTLYPIEQLEHDEVILCEGEWDALLLIQNGFAAVTRTGAADVWKPMWNVKFHGKTVHVIHDMDVKGQKANDKISRQLRDFASHVDVVKLPYDVTEKHGKDITDYMFLDANTPLDLYNLFQPEILPDDVEDRAQEIDVQVIDSFDSSQSGQELRMRVTITGKRNPTFLIPRVVDYSCSQDAGIKCNFCPMNELGGTAQRTVSRKDPRVMEMMGSTNKQVHETLRNLLGAQKCEKLAIEPEEMMSVEELYVRPSVEKAHHSGSGDYTNRKIISVGRHDSLPNNTVEVRGSIYPNPKGQQNEFLAWDVSKTETSIDRFDISPEVLTQLKKFRPSARQRPISKIAEINKDFVANVTKIYGRLEMHMMMDLVFHSVLGFEFGGMMEHRGWIDAIVVGDTRTGKSYAAQKLMEHLNVGEMISCESASFAGIVGGLQQFGSGKEWEISWGAIPLNDRRAVILDEVSGLATEQISQMSSIRSSGEAQLTKIRSERTWARTRLLWLGNPRDRRLGDFTYGAYALPDLIGNNEDIARFDLAMSVAADEVDAEEINRVHNSDTPHVFDTEACQNLVLWVWSRKPEQVLWEPGAQDAVLKHSIDMGKRYVEVPPLVQSANVRIKIARVAVAIAARTFSTDDTFENIVVNEQHVKDAVYFMDKLYGMVGFGYLEHSREQIDDAKEAARNYDKAKKVIAETKNLSKFLRASRGTFRRQDMEDMMNMNRDEAMGVINTLWNLRMVSRAGADVKILPLLHQILREVRE